MGFILTTLYAKLCLGYVGSISPPWLESRITDISLQLLGACIANTNALVHGFALYFTQESVLLGVELLGVRVLRRLVVAQETWPTWTLMALSGASHAAESRDQPVKSIVMLFIYVFAKAIIHCQQFKSVIFVLSFISHTRVGHRRKLVPFQVLFKYY